MTTEPDKAVYRMLGPVKDGASESWYREATNWLVGLATGGIAGLAAYIGHESAGTWGSYAGIAAILLFGVCIAAGVILHLWHVRGHSAAERLEQCKLVPGDESDDVRKQREAATAMFDRLYDEARRQRKRFHGVALTSFLLAMLAAAVAVFFVARPPERTIAVEVHDCTPANSVAHCIYWKTSDAPAYKVLWFFPDRIVELQWPGSSTTRVAIKGSHAKGD